MATPNQPASGDDQQEGEAEDMFMHETGGNV